MAAKEEWIDIYDSYSDEELTAEIATLKSQASNPYVTQSEGQRGYTRSINEARSKLAAAIQIQKDRTNAHKPRHGQADFSTFR